MKKLLMMLIGIGLLVAAVFFVKGQLDLEKKCTVETTGVVEKLHRLKRTDDAPMDAIISYQAGESRITSKISVNRSSFSIGPISFVNYSWNPGEQLTIFYNPEKPEEFYVDGENKGFKTGGILAFFGIICLAVGVFKKNEDM